MKIKAHRLLSLVITQPGSPRKLKFAREDGIAGSPRKLKFAREDGIIQMLQDSQILLVIPLLDSGIQGKIINKMIKNGSPAP